MNKMGEQTYKGVLSFTPTAKQVAKRIIKVGGGGAVTTAVDMLLDGVDWVLDPANNSVIYKPKDIECNDGSQTCINPYIYSIMIDVSYKTFNTAEEACNAYFERDFLKRTWVNEEIRKGAKVGIINGTSCVIIYPNGKVGSVNGANKIVNPAYDKTKTKQLSLDVVAEQIISNANAKDKTAIEFVGQVADEIVTQQEKEHQWEATKLIVISENTNEGIDSNTNPKTPALGKSKAQCKKEWDKAYDICEDLIKKGGYRGLTGNYQDISKCAKGFVTEECGGNKIEW